MLNILKLIFLVAFASGIWAGMASHHVAIWWRVAVAAVVIVGGQFVWNWIGGILAGPYLYAGAMPVSNDDPLMLRAREKARQTLQDFLTMFPEHRLDSMVKFRFTTDSQQDEHLWADLLEIQAGRATIYVRTRPVSQKGPMERRREIGVEEFEDWQIEFPDGTIRGGFTIRAQFKIAEREGSTIPRQLHEQLARYREVDGSAVSAGAIPTESTSDGDNTRPPLMP